MPDNFAITAASTTVRLDDARTGAMSFTVTNQTPQPRRGRAKVTAQNTDAEQWIIVAGEAERGFIGHGTQQYSVNIAAPAGALAGAYSFRLDMLGTENPDEDYTQGPSVSFTLPEVKQPEKRPARIRKIPWWAVLIAAIVIGAVVGGAVVGVIVSRPPVVDVQPYAGTWFNNDTPQPNDLAYLAITPSGTALSLHSFGQCGQSVCDLGVNAAPCTDKQCTASINQKGRVDNLTLTLTQGKTPALQVVDKWTAGLNSGTSTMNFHQATPAEIQAQQYVGTWVYVPPANYNYFSVADLHSTQIYELSITRQQSSLLVQAPTFCEVFSNCSPQVGPVRFSTTTAPEVVFSYCDVKFYYQDDLTLKLSTDGATLAVHEVLTLAARPPLATACTAPGNAQPLRPPLDYTMRRLAASGGQTTAGAGLSLAAEAEVAEADRRVVNR